MASRPVLLAGIGSIGRFSSTSSNAAAAVSSESVAQAGQQAAEAVAGPGAQAASAAAEQLASAASASPVADALASSSSAVAQAINPETTLQDIHAIGDLKAAGLGSYFTPVGLIQNALELVHVTTGMPWWASIIVVTLAIRGALTPLIISMQRTSAIMHNLKPEVDKITAAMNRARETKNSAELNMAAFQMRELYAKNGVNPLKALGIPLIQMPIFVSFFMGIRKIAEAGIPSFEQEHFLWVQSLAEADPTYGLPVVATAGFLAVLEMNAETGVSNPQVESMKKVFRFATVAALPFTSALPAGMFVYWITSSLYTMGQATILRNPNIRKRFNLPELVKHQPIDASGVPKELGFLDGFRASYNASREAHEKMLKEMEEAKKQQQAALASGSSGSSAKRIGGPKVVKRAVRRDT
ncbi:60Kd inner membrane protein-domain-containing protein [Catenaria anguillulae PL171]|uniref:60Kd inner membrane protein-domain-containing protein n=1 Tax=Catenaria anguillulae PL171 TaxID=765915 RepID=A0A1Y2HD36_9FUNG|nr:60Kd inner membrane protein-domain-containing protein [Catenaria anguillulae PL171]